MMFKKGDFSSVASIGSSPCSVLNQAKVGDAVNLSAMKKAMNIQEQTAAQLIEVLPQPACLTKIQVINKMALADDFCIAVDVVHLPSNMF